MKFIVKLFFIFVMSTALICAQTDANSEAYKGKDRKVEDVVDTVISWAIGITGAVSFVMCENVDKSRPVPVSFYTFNLAAVAYWAAEVFARDKNRHANEEVARRDYGGSNDEQMNSYKKLRDVAELNKEAAEKKGKYKLAASIAMMAAAAVALIEKGLYAAKVKDAEVETTEECTMSQGDQVLFNPGLIYMEKRCKNLGGAKVVCSDNDKDRLEKMENYCRNVAVNITKESVNGCAGLSSVFEKMNKGEKNGDVEAKKIDIQKDVSTLDDDLQDQVRNVLLAAHTGVPSASLDKSDNFLVKALTLGGLQYSPGVRAVTYGLLAAIVGANALANNVAAKEYEEEVEHYKGLIAGLEECGDNCHIGGDSDSGSGGDGETNSDGGCPVTQDGASCTAESFSIDQIAEWRGRANASSWPVVSGLSVAKSGSKLIFDFNQPASWVGDGHTCSEFFVIFKENGKWIAQVGDYLGCNKSEHVKVGFHNDWGPNNSYYNICKGDTVGFLVTSQSASGGNHVPMFERTSLDITCW